jgi:hypothetical protein
LTRDSDYERFDPAFSHLLPPLFVKQFEKIRSTLLFNGPKAAEGDRRHENFFNFLFFLSSARPTWCARPRSLVISTPAEWKIVMEGSFLACNEAPLKPPQAAKS